ncbi:MAG: hypothetical protein OXH01_01655 [Bacteroidetes bacterium]|nr:hypothetical protein [Bacteroidota bacterium]
MKRGIALVALFVVATPVLACEYCLGTGTANSGVIRALVFSMASLLTVIGFVGASIGTFFFKVHRRAKVLESERISGRPGDDQLVDQ